MKNKKIGFAVIRADLISSKKRGFEIAEALGCPCFLYSYETARQFEVIVYVKYPVAVEEMAQLKSAGVIQIIDVIDNFNLTSIRKRSASIDGLIAASLTHQIYLSRFFDVPVQAIPHHHVNYAEKRIQIKAPDEVQLGYIGHKKYWQPNRFVRKLGYPVYTDFVMAKPLDASYLEIDVGFAYRTDKKKNMFNSSLKLANFMSFGIPSVLNPESAYLEIANHGEHCLFAQGKEDFGGLLDYLVQNVALRKKISDNAFKKAQDFHIRKVVTYYRDFLQRFA